MALFISGTDTGVGKTWVCAALAGELKRLGVGVTTQKWIQTGCVDQSDDLLVHMAAMGDTHMDADRCPYVLPLPASPHLAAKAAGISIDIEIIKRAFHRLSTRYDQVLVEGAGGALVPVNQETLMIDIVRDLRLKVMIVVPNRVGCINHTLLTVEAYERRDIEVMGVVMNPINQEEDPAIAGDNPVIIQDLVKAPVFTIPKNSLRLPEALIEQVIQMTTLREG